MVNPHRDAENYFVAVKNRAINLKSVTIKWNGQLTKLFSEKNKKNGEGKQAKQKYGCFSVNNMI
jgi:hypothetical protein